MYGSDPTHFMIHGQTNLKIWCGNRIAARIDDRKLTGVSILSKIKFNDNFDMGFVKGNFTLSILFLISRRRIRLFRG